MDPELYVFPGIRSTPTKLAASTGLFIVVLVIAALLLPLLPGPQLWARVDQRILIGKVSVSFAQLMHLLIGYGLFIYGSYHAWRATRLKNTVEDPKHQLATRILDTGYYARVRHPVYGMFILANVGLGVAVNSVYGLAFGLLSLVLFIANGIFEERGHAAVLWRGIPFLHASRHGSLPHPRPGDRFGFGSDPEYRRAFLPITLIYYIWSRQYPKNVGRDCLSGGLFSLGENATFCR